MATITQTKPTTLDGTEGLSAKDEGDPLDETARPEAHPLDGKAHLEVLPLDRKAHPEDLPPKDEDDADRYKFRFTVEVPCFALYFCAAVTGTAMANMVINRTCIHTLGHSPEVCEQLNLPGDKPPEVMDIESEVQRFTTTVFTVKSLMDGFIPALLSVFLGPWSNKRGRKPLIIWPLFGYALSVALVLVYSHVDSLGPWWFIGLLLPYSFAGGTSTFTTGAVCLLNDLTNDKNKTLRMSIMTASLFSGMIVGLLGSSFIYGIIGASNLLIIALCASLCGFVFSLFFIKESVVKTGSGGIGALFDISLVTDMLRSCFKRRPDYQRLVLGLLILPYFIDQFVNIGGSQIEYLYARQRLNWNLPDMNLFSAVNTVIMIIGLYFGVVLLQKLFKFSDAVTGMIAYVSSAVEAIIKALVTSTWMMYFASAISVFSGLSFPVIRAMMSKRVARDDAAKFFALMSAVDAILPLVAPPVYNTLYGQTLDMLPGAAYMLSAGLYVICIVLMWTARCMMLRHPIRKNDFVSESVADTNRALSS